jgi:hypothetical protein
MTVLCELILKSKEHSDQAQGQPAFGVSGWFAAAELGGETMSFRFFDT